MLFKVVNGLYRLPLLVLISYKGNIKTKIVSNGEEEGKGERSKGVACILNKTLGVLSKVCSG